MMNTLTLAAGNRCSSVLPQPLLLSHLKHYRCWKLKRGADGPTASSQRHWLKRHHGLGARAVGMEGEPLLLPTLGSLPLPLGHWGSGREGTCGAVGGWPHKPRPLLTALCTFALSEARLYLRETRCPRRVAHGNCLLLAFKV